MCDKSWLLPTHVALLMIGSMFGSIIFGALSDRYGRKISYVVALVLQFFAGMGVVFAPEYISFVICRVIVGAASNGGFLVAYVMGKF